MNKSLILKLLLIGAMFFILMIPQGFIHDLVRARASLKQEARDDIVRSAAGAQVLKGPVVTA